MAKIVPGTATFKMWSATEVANAMSGLISQGAATIPNQHKPQNEKEKAEMAQFYLSTQAACPHTSQKGSSVALINLAISDVLPRSADQIAQLSGAKMSLVTKHLYDIGKAGMVKQMSAYEAKQVLDAVAKGAIPVPVSAGGSNDSQLNALKADLTKLEEKYTTAQQAYTDDLAEMVKRHKEELGRVKQESSQTIKKLIIKRPPSIKKTILKDVALPAVFDRIKQLAEARRNILLVGPAGCGKSFIGQFMAQVLGLPFGTIACTAGMTETHLYGRSTPNIRTGKPEFTGTEFLRCYEGGGVFLMDELDAADNNVLLSLNAPLTPTGRCSVVNRPSKPFAERHEDFVMIATANTFGRGANRVYAGRTQLDEASIDRFRIGIVECDYDAVVEKRLCPKEEIREPLQKLRERIERAGLRRVLSTRFLEDAHVMHEHAGWDLKQILEVFYEGWTADDRAKVSA